MITVFLPCRAGSERVPKKNTKAFCGIEGGLLKLKLEELLKVEGIYSIVVSTNDEEVIEITRNASERIIIDSRPEELASSATSTDELINYVPKIIKKGHVLWTHVTSPFLKAKDYDAAIKVYLKSLEEKTFDSLMSVNKLQTFLWSEKGSINYDRTIEKWPRTQTLSNVYEINSGIFINSISNYRNLNDRIGKKPFLFETEDYASFDIDWPKDFYMAELIYKNLNR
jgi:CMP-N-acetylneuraminic acid synthetase